MKTPRLIAAAALLALAGCGTTQIVYRPVPVNIPVPIPCKIAPVEAPAWPTASLPPKASLFDRAKAVLAELKLRQGYEGRLAAAVKACQ
jgi:hypothetical protein